MQDWQHWNTQVPVQADEMALPSFLEVWNHAYVSTPLQQAIERNLSRSLRLFSLPPGFHLDLPTGQTLEKFLAFPLIVHALE